MRKYILGIAITLFIALAGVFNSDTKALDNDYKNNLLKVDVSRVSGDTYTIDLFTQKPYSEPIKVRKKSDTSYYVLLPETYHSITSVQGSGDINKVDVKLYPYAGQDLNNGYTKINIQTSKPVNFSTNVRTATKQIPSLDTKKLAQLDSAFDSKPKTSQNVKSDPVKTAVKPVPVKVESVKPVPVNTEVAKTKVVDPVRARTATPVKVAVAPVTTEPSNTKVIDPVKTKTAAPVRVASVQQEDIQQEIMIQPQRAPHTANNEIEIVAKPSTKQKSVETEVNRESKELINLEEVVDPDVTKDDSSIEEEAKEQGLTELAEMDETEEIPALTLKQQIKQKVKVAAKIVRDNLALVIALLLLIIALRLLGTPKKAAQKDAPAENMAPTGYKPVQPEPVQSFTQQTVEPEPVVSAAPAAKPEAETLAPAAQNRAEFDVYKSHIEPAPTVAPIEIPVTTAAVEEISTAPAAQVQAENEEADVLASESFGDGRGLCLVNFNGDIALVGYIEDEIFVIQNFGKVTLINPAIQVRIAEQNDDSTVYIVKAANSKLMVKETKTFIGLEMVM